MRHCTLGLALTVACLGVWPFASTARALMIAPAPGPTRVINSDAVIVGKVTALEPQDMTVANVNYRIAVVQVDQALRGIKDAKTLRVGFIPPPMVLPGKGPIIRPGFRGVQLQQGNAGLFLLKKHPTENFYTLGGPAGYFISSENNDAFDKDVQAIKSIGKIMENPKAALTAQNADDRLMAAAVLIEKYRIFRGPGQAKQEPIDADESKQILQAVAAADWKAPVGFGSLRPNPQQLFGRLGITQKDGFVVQPGANYQVAAQTWLRDNAEKYRIQRYVAAETK